MTSSLTHPDLTRPGMVPTHIPTDLRPVSSRLVAMQYDTPYKVISRQLSKGATVLDWGTGNGHTSTFLTHAGYRTTGFSFYDFQSRASLEKTGYQFVLGSIAEPTQLPFAGASFDAIVSMGVLEHVHEVGGSVEGSLEEIVRVLKPGGTFICCHLPNHKSYIEWCLRHVVSGIYHHPFLFDANQIRQHFSSAGLQIVSMATYGSLPYNPASALPSSVTNHPLIARLWHGCDQLLTPVLSKYCQNWLVTARKPVDVAR